nr:TolC family protein [Caulobacter sp. 17J65-9]
MGVIVAALALVSPALAEPAPSFPDLLRQAEATSPRLAESLAQVRAAEGRARQASARPNPELGLEVENFGGGEPFDGFAVAETTLSVAQPLELGGKRGARIGAARADVELARARQRQTMADFAFDLAAAYAEAEAADRRLVLAQEGLELAQTDARAARSLVDAGREAELRAVQSNAAVSAARADLDEAQAARSTAFARLTALAGSPTVFTSLDGSVLQDGPGQIAAPLAAQVTSPAVLAAEAEREAAARRVRMERTRATPDVTVAFGLRRFQGDDSTALVAGVSAPIPVFDRNQGNTAAAQGELQAAEARLNAARLDAEAELRSAQAQATAAQTRLAAATEGETTAAEAYRLARVGYDAGRLPLLEVLNARRTLAEARARTLDARLARLRSEAGLARLQGRAYGA